MNALFTYTFSFLCCDTSTILPFFFLRGQCAKWSHTRSCVLICDFDSGTVLYCGRVLVWPKMTSLFPDLHMSYNLLSIMNTKRKEQGSYSRKFSNIVKENGV